MHEEQVAGCAGGEDPWIGRASCDVAEEFLDNHVQETSILQVQGGMELATKELGREEVREEARWFITTCGKRSRLHSTQLEIDKDGLRWPPKRRGPGRIPISVAIREKAIRSNST